MFGQSRCLALIGAPDLVDVLHLRNILLHSGQARFQGPPGKDSARFDMGDQARGHGLETAVVVGR